MPIIEYKAQLDFTDNGVFETGWRIKQGDYGSCQLVFFVTNNGENQFDVGITPQIGFRRADGMSIVSELTPEDPFYTYTFVGNELEIPGPTLVDVKYVYVDGRISTATCRFDVVPDTIGYDPTGAGTYNNPVSALAEMALSTAQQAEAWAVGTKNGSPVSSGDPTYHNNSKYWSELRMGSKIKNTTGRFYTTTGGMLDSCVVALSPKQSGSGTPSPSNVRPITGHTSGEVLRTGKNLLSRPYSFEITGQTSRGGVNYQINDDGSLTLTGKRTTGQSATYLFLDNAQTPNALNHLIGVPIIMRGTVSNICNIQFWTANGNKTIASDTVFTLTAEDLATTWNLAGAVQYTNSNLNNTVYPMICLATETDTTYEPYQPKQDITIQFGNTYYGGTFDFVSGVLTVTDAFLTIENVTSSDLLYAATDNYARVEYQPMRTMGKAYSNYLSDKFEPTDGSATTTYQIARSENDNVRCWFTFPKTLVTSVSDAVTVLNDLKPQVIYKLATPLRIGLTPSQINTLVGQNNLSAPLEGQSFASAEYRDNMSVVYITDERVVGKWINGKDIYQRTIDLGSSGVSVPANSSASTGLAKGNVELPIWSTAISPSGQAFPHIGCSVGSTYIMMENKAGNATTVRYFTFQYTKTS